MESHDHSVHAHTSMCSLHYHISNLILNWFLFSRFPLQEPGRLQQWLRNMGRENWAPSRHQYICHQHFAPSCFRVRWGIRYLESDAVPTVFHEVEVKRTRTRTQPHRLVLINQSCTLSFFIISLIVKKLHYNKQLSDQVYLQGLYLCN